MKGHETTTFTPNFSAIASFPAHATAQRLLAQRGFYAADLGFAYAHAGAELRAMLDAIPDWYRALAAENVQELNIDVRVHQMRRGDYPASPGWHVDAAQRETDFEEMAGRVDVSHSLVGTMSTSSRGVSNTIFVRDEISLDGAYEELTAANNALLQEELAGKNFKVVATEDGQWTLFDPYSIHNVQAAKVDGVRLFVRVSIWSKPEGHSPGLTKTEQVYSVV